MCTRVKVEQEVEISDRNQFFCLFLLNEKIGTVERKTLHTDYSSVEVTRLTFSYIILCVIFNI